MKWIIVLTKRTGILAHWRLRLFEFDFNVVHRAGVSCQATDAPSYLQAAGEVDTRAEDKLPVLPIDTESDDTNILVINRNSDEIILIIAQEKKWIDSPPKSKESTPEQALNKHCKALSLNVDHTGSRNCIDGRDLLDQKFIVGEFTTTTTLPSIWTSRHLRNGYIRYIAKK